MKFIHQQADRFDENDAADQAHVAGNRRQQHRFLQNQADNRKGRCAERFANADFARALLHDNQHDIADADDSGHNRSRSNQPDKQVDALE